MNTIPRLPRHVTFTGVDDHTDLGDLATLSEQYPGLVEWGVLIGARTGPRYPSATTIHRLIAMAAHRPIFLSLHTCGVKTQALFRGHWDVLPPLPSFTRLQANAVNYPENMAHLAAAAGRPIICQVRTGFPPGTGASGPPVQFLFDQSEGRGESPRAWPTPPTPADFVGFAGGIGPENVRQVLQAIPCADQSFWIDMESGVRSNDRFDLAKVATVLRRTFAFEVRYRVRGYVGEKAAGPFPAETVGSHMADIGGFDHVYAVRLVTVPPRLYEIHYMVGPYGTMPGAAVAGPLFEDQLAPAQARIAQMPHAHSLVVRLAPELGIHDDEEEIGAQEIDHA